MKINDARIQILVYSTVLLGVLGSFNGLNALGGGGLADPLMATKMAATYAFTLAATGWLGGKVFDSLGARLTVVVGSCCYLVFVTMIMCHRNVPPGAIYLGGIVVGFGATLIWTCFGVYSISYPVRKQRGFIALWAVLNSGSFGLGCYGLFAPPHAGGLTPGNYRAILGLMTCCIVASAIFLRPIHQVIRSDGSCIAPPPPKKGLVKPSQPAKAQMREVAGMPPEEPPQQSPRAWGADAMILALLLPLLLAPNMHYPFLFNGLNGQYFNVRSRAFNTALYSFVRVPGSLSLLYVYNRHSTTTIGGLYYTVIVAACGLVTAYFIIFDIFGGTSLGGHRLDVFRDFSASAMLIACFVAFALVDSVSQTLIYAVLAALSGSDPSKTAYYCGIYKGIMSTGLGIYWALDWYLMSSKAEVVKRYQVLWVSLAVQWIIAVPSAVLSLLLLHRHHTCLRCGSHNVHTYKHLCLHCSCEGSCGVCDPCVVSEHAS